MHVPFFIRYVAWILGILLHILPVSSSNVSQENQPKINGRNVHDNWKGKKRNSSTIKEYVMISNAKRVHWENQIENIVFFKFSYTVQHLLQFVMHLIEFGYHFTGSLQKLACENWHFCLIYSQCAYVTCITEDFNVVKILLLFKIWFCVQWNGAKIDISNTLHKISSINKVMKNASNCMSLRKKVLREND